MGCSRDPETQNYTEWSGVTLEHGAERILGGLNTLGSVSTLAVWGRYWGRGSHLGGGNPRDEGDVLCGRQTFPSVESMLRLK